MARREVKINVPETRTKNGQLIKPLRLVAVVLVLPLVAIITWGESFGSVIQRWQESPPSPLMMSAAVVATYPALGQQSDRYGWLPMALCVGRPTANLTEICARGIRFKSRGIAIPRLCTGS